MSKERETTQSGRVLATRTFACVGRRRVGPVLLVMALFSIFAIKASGAEAPKARIVGLGATTCQQFNDDIKANPAFRRDYLA